MRFVQAKFQSVCPLLKEDLLAGILGLTPDGFSSALRVGVSGGLYCAQQVPSRF